MPGDWARVEPDGSVTLLGRGNTCVNTGGEKVFPEEVEGALKSHPDVFDSLVIGVPDELLGQRVAALVQLWAGRPADLAGIEAHVRGQIAGYKVPRRIWLVDDIQRTAAGKADYRWAQQYAAAHPAASSPAPGPGGRGLARHERGHADPAVRRPRYRAPHPRVHPSEHVAAAISRAGGLGVLGCVRFNDPDELDAVLHWMDKNTGGRPYGVDVVMPATVPAEGAPLDLGSLIPGEHRDFVEQTLIKLGVPPLPEGDAAADGVLGWLHSVARQHVEVALAHPARLIANALGSPPPDVIARAHERGMLVAALSGKAEHARRHVERGVDMVIAQGYEAGGHTGEIASMVLVPEIADAVGAQVPVLAAGGIGCGRQIVAALALGAVGVWMGSAWLTTEEYTLTSDMPAVRDALLAATSSDTVRSRIYSGKPARLLRNRWTQAWSEPDAPAPLPMPLQNLLVSEAHQRLMRSGQPDVVPMPVGQIVGRMNAVRPVAEVMSALLSEAEEALTRLGDLRGHGMKIATVAGYWGSGPPADGAGLFAAADRLRLDQIWTAEAWGSDALDPAGVVGIAHLARAPGHRRVAAVGAAARHAGHDRDDHGPPHPRPGHHRGRHQQPAGGRGLVRPALPAPAGAHPGVHRHPPGGHRPPGPGGLRRQALSAAVSRRDGTGQAAALHPASLPARDPGLPGRGRAEECGAGRRDRRRLEHDLLLPVDERLLRRRPRRGLRPPGARHTSATFDVVGGPMRIIVDDDLERAADLLRPSLALYIGGMGARRLNFHHEVFARMGWEAQARVIQDRYLAGDKQGAIAAVPTRLVEDVALIGSWAKIADEIQRWRETVLTTFTVSTDLHHLDRVVALLRG